MKENETFDEFYVEINDIVNSSFNLSETIHMNMMIVRKIFRSLLERFLLKITTIEESNDLNHLTLEDLVGKLQVYESKLPDYRKPTYLAMNTGKEVIHDSSDNDKDDEMSMFVKKV